MQARAQVPAAARSCRKLIVLGCGTLLAGPLCTFARLGDTEARCWDRYGTGNEELLDRSLPLIPGAVNRTCHFEGWTIRFAFVKGMVVREEFTKISGNKGDPRFTEQEVEKILNAEGGAYAWQPHLPPAKGATDKQQEITRRARLFGAGTSWVRSDGALAMLQTSRSVLRIETGNAEQVAIELRRQQEQKKTTPKL